VNHLWGHIYAAMLTRPELTPPLLALCVSGAHTDLVLMPAHGRFEVLGRTRDDAAGEAFGESGQPAGRHHGDQTARWRSGDPPPLPLSRSRLGAGEATLVLRPR